MNQQMAKRESPVERSRILSFRLPLVGLLILNFAFIARVPIAQLRAGMEDTGMEVATATSVAARESADEPSKAGPAAQADAVDPGTQSSADPNQLADAAPTVDEPGAEADPPADGGTPATASVDQPGGETDPPAGDSRAPESGQPPLVAGDPEPDRPSPADTGLATLSVIENLARDSAAIGGSLTRQLRLLAADFRPVLRPPGSGSMGDPGHVAATQGDSDTQPDMLESTVDPLAPVTVPPTPDAPTGTTPAQPSVGEFQVVLANDLRAGVMVHFLVDGRLHSLEPGEGMTLEGAGPYLLQFHRGGDFGSASLDVSTGAYLFGAGPNGWTLSEQ